MRANADGVFARVGKARGMNGALQLANALALTSAAGLLMLLSGKKKKMLRWMPRRSLRERLRRR
jgi:hypothetical protein